MSHFQKKCGNFGQRIAGTIEIKRKQVKETQKTIQQQQKTQEILCILGVFVFDLSLLHGLEAQSFSVS